MRSIQPSYVLHIANKTFVKFKTDQLLLAMVVLEKHIL